MLACRELGDEAGLLSLNFSKPPFQYGIASTSVTLTSQTTTVRKPTARSLRARPPHPDPLRRKHARSDRNPRANPRHHHS